jgi:hypothetical protein
MTMLYEQSFILLLALVHRCCLPFHFEQEHYLLSVFWI